ncbi:Glutamate receptor ionotropic kainate 1 [Taenia crassiceps]|uniref:Glutamate receptor ionotropic kainate 1 n=1 Tax=Taenia crassiceps TaxID=6207 RepID=A0ABR4QMN5_9CEST
MSWFFLHLFFIFVPCSYCKASGGIVPVAYSTDLGVQPNQFNSVYLQSVLINPNEFKWPSNSTAGIYRAAVGDFSYYFGLNTTEESVAYFITGNLPPRRTNTSSWLRIAPYLSDLAPIVKELAKQGLETEESVFISDASPECRELRELTSPSFKWSILTSVNSSRLSEELSQLKSYVNGKIVHYALCDGNVESIFSQQVLTKLLETGLYFGSKIYVYTKRKADDNNIQEAFKSFADAGASLAVVSPVLCGSKSAPVEVSLKALEQLSQNYVDDSVIQLNGQSVPFNSPNFLRLIQTTVIQVPICNRSNFTICFTKDGFLCIIDVNIYGIGPGIASLPSSGFYDHRTGQLTLLPNIYHRPVVKLLAFQDTTFLPSLENSQFSMAMQMIKEIFTTKAPYEYEIVPVAYSKDVIVQRAVEDYLSRSDVTLTMSAFPLPLDTGTKARHTGAVLYDGIVMVKSRKTSQLVLFRIFDSLSGFIWLCVFASLIFVAIIFFAIKVVYYHQTRSMGVVPEDEDIPLFKRFLTVIFQNFSAVLLAKMLVKPKLTSLRVLYQSYWMASIFIVATYAASLAEQRFVERDTMVPFNSLHGLLKNTANYRWLFLRNSSVIWMMQHSQDTTLKDLLGKAERDWPQEMYVESVSEVATRIKDNDHLILISSRLEAKQILSEECGLMKVTSLGGKSGPVEYLYALGYFLSGNDNFATQMTNRIDDVSTERTFNFIEARTLGMGDCPLSSEKINMQHNPFSLRELGGLFIIALVGIIIAFIVAGIEFVVEKYPMYKQRKKGEGIRFGGTYASEVLDIKDNGIWIRLLENDTTAFVDASRIKTTRGSDGRPHLEMGSFVKATYMGNDPHTADPIFSVTEEKVFKLEHGGVVPPNN